MMRKLLAVTSVIALAAVASADITAAVVPVVEAGTLINSPNEGVEYWTWDVQVTVTGDDTWTVAGGPNVGDPWCTVVEGTFYQNLYNDTNPPNPVFFDIANYEDSEWTSFYTTHLGYPNTSAIGTSPSFAYGPDDTDTALNADWFWTPDTSDYPGTYTIARFTLIEDNPGTAATATIDLQYGTRDLGLCGTLQTTVSTPEPASLALLALGGLALIRRR